MNTMSGTGDQHLSLRRPVLRVTKVSPVDVGRLIKNFMRRFAVFVITSLLFAIVINIFYKSIKMFFRLPGNTTKDNQTGQNSEVS